MLHDRDELLDACVISTTRAESVLLLVKKSIKISEDEAEHRIPSREKNAKKITKIIESEN